jgi:hypothetical protein
MENVIDQEEVMSHKVNRWKKILFVPVLGVLLLAGGVARTQAGDNERQCDQRIHKAEENLRKAVDRHGEHSSQAEKRRHELEEAKRSCGGDRDRHY